MPLAPSAEVSNNLPDPMVEFNGEKVSYARARYLLAQRNQSTLAKVNALAMKNARDVFLTGAELDRQTFGGFVRKVLPPIVDQWGNVNAVAAMEHYDASRDLWYQVHGSKVSGSQAYARSTRYADAVTSGRIYKATIPNFDALALSDPIVNEMMKQFAASGFDASSAAGQNALTRTIAQYNRDTMLFNSGLDESVNRVQRVAEFNACGFCKTLAVGGYGRTTTRTSDYAVNWHNHCRCSIEVLFNGDPEVRPDYYDDIERDLRRAQDSVGNRPADVARELDRLSAGRTRPLKATPATPKAPATPVKPAPGKYKASDWYWDPRFQGDEAAKLANQLKAYDIAMEEAATVPRLKAPDALEDALKNSNPLYNVKPGYADNCARVVNAYELRRRGWDVTANRSDLRGLSQVRKYYMGAWKTPEGLPVYQTGQSIKKGLRNKEAWLQETMTAQYPDGARGTIAFEWVNANSRHVINWEKIDGRIVWIDAQIAKAIDNPENYFRRGKNHEWFRLDNAEPTAALLRYTEEPS